MGDPGYPSAPAGGGRVLESGLSCKVSLPPSYKAQANGFSAISKVFLNAALTAFYHPNFNRLSIDCVIFAVGF
jgi:hypothetical protein